MSVNTLWVEGKLDVELMVSIASTQPGGAPSIRSAGGKSSLRPKVTDDRKGDIEACYLRDRDFDSDPPADLSAPTVDKVSRGVVHGWRWCRHEIENYLLEPEFVAQATGWSRVDFEATLLAAARSLRHYTAARWAVGTARRALPPLFELGTRPIDLTNEIKVPGDLSEQASRDWASGHIGDFRKKVQGELADTTLASSFERWSLRLDAVKDPHEVLLLYAGKDLLAALEPEMVRRPFNNPVVFRNAIRDWIMVHPTQALALLPEWTALLRLLA